MRISGFVGLALVALAAVAGCTSGSSPSDPGSTIVETITRTQTPGPSPAQPSTGAPVSGSTSAAPSGDCPLLSRDTAANRSGMRLDKITVLRSGGKVVGCRIYGLQYPANGCSQSCLDAEDLPPGNQPAIEVTTDRYGSANDAHNAFVRLAGSSAQQAEVASGNTGLCFQTDFYAADKGMDWACTFSDGATLVLVKTVITSPSYTAIEVTKAVAANLA